MRPLFRLPISRLMTTAALVACLTACSGAELAPAADPGALGGTSIAYAPEAVRAPTAVAATPTGTLPAPQVTGFGAPAPAARPLAAAPARAPALAPATPSADLGGFTFRFQVGDEVGIDVWQEKDLSVVQRVLRDGTIAPPLLDPVRVAGRSVQEVRAELLQTYGAYLREPRITVRVVSVQSDRVFVLGEVRTPAAVASVGETTLLQAVAQAGGFIPEAADLARVRVVRPAAPGAPARVMTIDANQVLAGRAANMRLQPGDIVYVPTTGLADWSRRFTQAVTPIATLIGGAGGIATTILAVQGTRD